MVLDADEHGFHMSRDGRCCKQGVAGNSSGTRHKGGQGERGGSGAKSEGAGTGNKGAGDGKKSGTPGGERHKD